MRCFTWRHRAEHGGLPRDGGRRCDMLGLRAARHRSCPILRRLDSVMCIRRRFHRERLFPLFGPQFARPFTVLAVELFGHPDHRAVDHGAVVAGQVYDPGLDDKAAEFDQMPGALAAFDLPCAHVMPRPCRLMPVARCPVAFERRQCRGQALA